MEKKNGPSLKLKIENTFYHNKGEATSPHTKTLISYHDLIKSQENICDKKEEDLILIPYREGDSVAIRYFSLQDLNITPKIINVYIMTTNCLSYHSTRTFSGYINKLNKIIEDKKEDDYFIEITSLDITSTKEEEISFLPMSEKEIKEGEKSIIPFNKKSDNNKVIFNKNGDDIKVTLSKDPNYIYFIIIRLENNKIYIFDPFSNRTLKHYSKKKDSYLNKLYFDNKKAMVVYHHESIFENNSNKFRKFLVYELNSYEIISRIFDCVNEHSKTKITIDTLLQILKIMQSQSNKCYNVSNNTNAAKGNSSDINSPINENEDLFDEPSEPEVKIEENWMNSDSRVIKYNDIIIFERKFFNGIFNNTMYLFWDSTLWYKIFSLKGEPFLGYYVLEDNQWYLCVNGNLVARYNLKDFFEILNEKVLLEKILSVEKLLND